MASVYPIHSSGSEFDRLRAQADLFRGDALALLAGLGVRPGWRCLELCCGIGGIVDLLSPLVRDAGEVVALDADEGKLQVARAWARAGGLDNVRFVRGDAFATGLPAGSFDLVHTRFGPSVISNGPAMLGHILELVRPGGIVFLEEVDLQSCACFPPHPAWDRALSAMRDCFTAIGADVFLGRKLNQLLRREGIEVTLIRPCSHALRAGEPMHHHIPWTVEAMRESIVDLGLLDGPTLDGTVRELDGHLAHPDTVTLSFTMVQVVGRKPGVAAGLLARET